MHYFVSILVLQITLRRKRKWVALLLLSYRCIVTIDVVCDCGISWSYSLTFWSDATPTPKIEKKAKKKKKKKKRKKKRKKKNEKKKKTES